MFGSQAISENSIAADGVVLVGSQTLDANFTQSTDLSGTFLGSMTVDAFFSKLVAASGTLVAEIDISSDFTQTTDGVRFAITSASLDASLTKLLLPTLSPLGLRQ